MFRTHCLIFLLILFRRILSFLSVFLRSSIRAFASSPSCDFLFAFVSSSSFFETFYIVLSLCEVCASGLFSSVLTRDIHLCFLRPLRWFCCAFCCCGILGSLLLRECLRGGDSFNAWFGRSTVVLLVCSSAYSLFFQIGIFRFCHGWRSLALVPGRFWYDLCSENSFMPLPSFCLPFGSHLPLGLETQSVPQWSLCSVSCECLRGGDSFNSWFVRSTVVLLVFSSASSLFVSCFSCRSVCIFGLDQVDRKLNVLHQSWRDSTLLRPQQGERAIDKPSVRWKKFKTLILWWKTTARAYTRGTEWRTNKSPNQLHWYHRRWQRWHRNKGTCCA